jgi:3-oxoadipate CoA-transferase alpha subunit
LINKLVNSAAEALRDVHDGSTVVISGFGDPGTPFALIEALLERAPRELTLVANNAGTGHEGIAALLEKRLVRKIICTYPRRTGSVVFEELYRKGEIELELVPQGTLSERLRSAKAGICGFYTPCTHGTVLAQGKEVRDIGGRQCVLEHPLAADFAFVRAHRADRYGNLVYQAAQRNFGPIMAGSARCTVAEVDHIAAPGEIDPEAVVTPGIFVDRVVRP